MALNFVVKADCNLMNFSVAVDVDLYIDLMLPLILFYRYSLLVDCKKVKRPSLNSLLKTVVFKSYPIFEVVFCFKHSSCVVILASSGQSYSDLSDQLQLTLTSIHCYSSEV